MKRPCCCSPKGRRGGKVGGKQLLRAISVPSVVDDPPPESLDHAHSTRPRTIQGQAGRLSRGYASTVNAVGDVPNIPLLIVIRGWDAAGRGGVATSTRASGARRPRLLFLFGPAHRTCGAMDARLPKASTCVHPDHLRAIRSPLAIGHRRFQLRWNGRTTNQQAFKLPMLRWGAIHCA